MGDSEPPFSRQIKIKAARKLKAQRAGSLQGAPGRSQGTAEQMEISRLRAELARVTMERDILGKAMAYFAKGQR